MIFRVLKQITHKIMHDLTWNSLGHLKEKELQDSSAQCELCRIKLIACASTYMMAIYLSSVVV